MQGHVKAVQYLAKREAEGLGGMDIVNLGTGKPFSVLQLVAAFGRASGRAIPYRLGPRRPGDVETVWADASRAETLLGWRAELGLDDSACYCSFFPPHSPAPSHDTFPRIAVCADSWRWISQNPDGYGTAA